MRRGAHVSRAAASTQLGRGPRDIEILTPSIAFCFQGVKLQPSDIYIYIFLSIPKICCKSNYYFCPVSVLTTQIVCVIPPHPFNPSGSYRSFLQSQTDGCC